MEEKTSVQNAENEEVVNVAEENVSAVEEEDELFDMDMAEANADEMFEQQELEEKGQFKEIEGFASIFPDNWVILPPTDLQKVSNIVQKQLSKKKALKK